MWPATTTFGNLVKISRDNRFAGSLWAKAARFGKLFESGRARVHATIVCILIRLRRRRPCAISSKWGRWPCWERQEEVPSRPTYPWSHRLIHSISRWFHGKAEPRNWTPPKKLRTTSDGGNDPHGWTNHLPPPFTCFGTADAISHPCEKGGVNS